MSNSINRIRQNFLYIKIFLQFDWLNWTKILYVKIFVQFDWLNWTNIIIYKKFCAIQSIKMDKNYLYKFILSISINRIRKTFLYIKFCPFRFQSIKMDKFFYINKFVHFNQSKWTNFFIYKILFISIDRNGQNLLINELL